jgi:hypothetical protein
LQNSSPKIENHLCRHDEILEIINVGRRDHGQSLFNDVGANADIVDVVFQ